MFKTAEEWQEYGRKVGAGQQPFGKTGQYLWEQTVPIVAIRPRPTQGGMDPDSVADDGLSFHENYYMSEQADGRYDGSEQ